ncbi:hypothetical protein TIFTF001_027835 [Ficus carica]|uniref:Uncharacterized protein n=1 Tax=Ficus carica TaxID=3494 RepID=A0AA88DNR3_FICCA|nr:hypothetical protein TIFTF001_027835 [Ficus carica]
MAALNTEEGCLSGKIMGCSPTKIGSCVGGSCEASFDIWSQVSVDFAMGMVQSIPK